jgi:hypothetical protein
MARAAADYLVARTGNRSVMDDTTTLPMRIAAGTHRASATLADFTMTVPRIDRN